MRSACAMGLLILVMIVSNGCLFEPRTADKPSGTDQYPWVTPYVFGNVLRNLSTGFASNVDSNYQRSLDDATYTFIPSSADALSFPPEAFANWTKAVESEWLRRIKTLYVGARTLRFGDENGNFTSKDERQLGGARQQADLARMGFQNQLGGQQQQFQQGIINQAVQDYATQQQYPIMQLGVMSNLLRGLPMQSSSTQMYQAQPSGAQQMLGMGMGALGAYKAFS